MSHCLLCPSRDQENSIFLPSYGGLVCRVCAVCGTCGHRVPDEAAMRVNWATAMCWHADCCRWCATCEDWRSLTDFATRRHTQCRRHCERCGVDYQNARGAAVIPDRGQRVLHLQRECVNPVGAMNRV